MEKLSDKSFSQKVKPFFAICVVLLLYFWGVSTTVTGEVANTNDESTCNTETKQEMIDVQISSDPMRIISIRDSLIDCRKFQDKIFETKMPIEPEWFLKPTVSASPAESTESQPTEEVQLPKVSSLDSRLPALVYLRINPDDPTGPLLLSDERVSEDDIEIDISNAIDSSLEYEVPYDLEMCFARIVFREAGNQPPLGQLKVAEGAVTRVRSGIYGADIAAILLKGYLVETDEAGYHVYDGNGVEVIDVPETAIAMTRLALRGSNTTKLVLEAGTALRNEQFGLELGEEYYQYGAFYHYSPEDVDEGALRSRVIGRVPVSYRYVDHVFYGKWLNAKYALNIE